MAIRFFERIGSVAARFYPLVIVFWLGVAGLAWYMAPPLEEVTKAGDVDLLPEDAASVQAESILSEKFSRGDTTLSAFVVLRRDGGLWPEDEFYIKELTEWLRSSSAPEELSEVLSPIDSPDLQRALESSDGEASLIRVTFTTSPWQPATVRAIEQLRERLSSFPQGLEVHLSGSAAIYADTKTTIQSSVDRTGPLTIGLVIVILLAIYRSPVAPIVPLVTIGVSFFTSRNLIAIIGQYVNVSSMVETFLIAVLFGAGTDYCLFMISRYREELGAGRSPREAVVRTMGVIGEAISSSAATVIVGLGAMAFATFGLFNSLGPSIALGVFVTLLAGLTLTPALMAILGTLLFWPLRPARAAVVGRWSPWPRISRLVVQHPVKVLVLALALLGGLSAGFFGLTRDYDLMASLPPDSDSVKGFRVMGDHFGSGSALPVTIVVDRGRQMFSDLLAVYKLTEDLRGLEGVSGVRSPMAPLGEMVPRSVLDTTPQQLMVSEPELARAIGSYLSTDYGAAKIDVSLRYDPYSRDALDFLPVLKEKVYSSLRGTSLESADIHFAGATPITADLRDITDADTVRVTLIVLGAVFVILALLLRSLVAPVYLVVTILLSYAATLGVVTFVVQGVKLEPGVEWSLPFIVFIMLFALGEDYNIFLMSRVKEEVGLNGTQEGIRRAVERTGAIITSCGIIMIGTFGVLVVSPVRTMTESGMAIAIGIFFDTFIVRTILVPSVAVLLGRWSWWPRRQRQPGKVELRQLTRTGG